MSLAQANQGGKMVTDGPQPVDTSAQIDDCCRVSGRPEDRSDHDHNRCVCTKLVADRVAQLLVPGADVLVSRSQIEGSKRQRPLADLGQRPNPESELEQPVLHRGELFIRQPTGLMELGQSHELIGDGRHIATGARLA